jgi:hypothetical protein
VASSLLLVRDENLEKKGPHVAARKVRGSYGGAVPRYALSIATRTTVTTMMATDDDRAVAAEYLRLVIHAQADLRAGGLEAV